MDRVILHCDANSYFASVECIDHPEWREIPMAVAGDPESRHGIILAKNEHAKRYGVKTAEPIWQARKKCPSLLVVRPNGRSYSHYSRLINEIYGRYTDQVEPFSIDESWLDVTGSRRLFGDGKRIADELRARVREELGITISVGVSFNKTFAKMGSDYKKPDATTVISRENFREILFPLPVETMMFVGERASQALRRAYIETIGDLARATPERLVSILGKSGEMLWAHANGVDESPVRRPDQGDSAQSVGCGITFHRDLRGLEDIRAGLMMLADTVGGRLRAQELKGRTVQILIKNPALKSITRQRTLPEPTSSTREIYRTALELIQASWRPEDPIRMLQLTSTNFTDSAYMQLSFFRESDPAAKERRARLERTVDDIRRRFGHGSIVSGRVAGSDLAGYDRRGGDGEAQAGEEGQEDAGKDETKRRGKR